ncbi:Crp/Fnr family transcriptional regulator [Paenibacillus tengchongensis]|uniref:Crp/Fnr family transcriptional regulator n=1 Tax=Paenibacillus tengchongensis TaxID=2608684 RepID=UPI001651CC53|nr:Crp/Fnr family transcriptional regulator [Paenibacillus tengchongensis]
MAAVEQMVDSVHVEKGSFVVREGELSDSLFIVKSGLVKLTQSTPEGKQHLVRLLFPGDYFGQYSLLHHQASDVSAEVVKSGLICQLHREDFLPLLRENAELSFHFLLALSKQLHDAEEQAGVLQMLDVEKRLARLLLHLYEKETAQPPVPEIRLPSAKKEVAAMIGTTAETFSRKLSKFADLKLIAVHQRRIELKDIEALQQMAETECGRG